MKLSDAIALGRTLVPELEAANLNKCALGMAGLARGLDMVTGKYVALEAEWPWLVNPGSICKCGHNQGLSRLFDIIHIFDYHIMLIGDWTLDQLIDWVRSVEPELAQEDAKEVLAAEIERQKERIEENELEMRADLVRGEEE